MAGFKSGLLWGAFFGTVAGLMNAPAKGSETRKNLKIFIDQTKEDVFIINQQKNHLMTVLEQLKEKNVPELMDQVEEFKINVREYHELAKPRLNRIKRRVEVLNSHLNDISS